MPGNCLLFLQNTPPRRAFSDCAHPQMADGEWVPQTTSTFNFTLKTSILSSHNLTPIKFSQLCCSLTQPCSRRHSLVRHADGCRPWRHSLFSVFKCLRSTSAVTALVPMSAVLCSPFRCSVRISVSTCSWSHNIGQCICPDSSCSTSFHDTLRWTCPFTPA